MTETQHSEAFARWLVLHRYIFTHIANESGLPPKVAMIVGAKKKRMGVSPGVPDFMIILKRGSLLFLEMKKERGPKGGLNDSHIDPTQEEWIQALSSINNVGAFFAHGYEDAIRIVNEMEKI
ncbi:MAG: VRR-NUC domain-containing protein [Candidatus Gracilibacteria bacterium]